MDKRSAKYLALIVAFAGAVSLPATGFARSAEEDAYMQYIDYCLGTGGKRSLCECGYKVLKGKTDVKELYQTAYNLRAGVPSEPLSIAKFKDASTQCAAQEEATAAAVPPPVEMPPPPPPLSVPPLPDKEKPEEEKKKNIAIDSMESDFLTQIKGKREMPAPPIRPGEEESAVDQTPPEMRAASSRPKKSGGNSSGGPVGSSRPDYYGQYDGLFFEAAATGNLQAMTAITSYLRNVDIKDEAGNTPLMVAVQYGQTTAIQFLLEKKANVNAANLKKQTALHLAAYARRPDLVELLINNKANVNATYNGGYTPLMLAILAQDETSMRLLTAAGSRDSKLENGDTLMHLAAGTDNPSVIYKVALSGAKVDEKNKKGLTPLMIAAMNDRAAATQRLLELGASLKTETPQKKNAYQLAYEANARNAANAILTFMQRQGTR